MIVKIEMTAFIGDLTGIMLDPPEDDPHGVIPVNKIARALCFPHRNLSPAACGISDSAFEVLFKSGIKVRPGFTEDSTKAVDRLFRSIKISTIPSGDATEPPAETVSARGDDNFQLGE